MRRKRAFKRDRIVLILAAAGVGYLIGSWNAAAVRGDDHSPATTAAQAVALRFPPAMRDAPVLQAAAYEHAAVAEATVLGRAQLALFEPEPMAPRAGAPVLQAAIQPSATDTAGLPPAAPPSSAMEPLSPTPGGPHVAAKPPIATAARPANRDRLMLDDAQIASIKRRLHLTPDQERMWPAVEAALRNLGAARSREARRRGAPDAIDLNSAEVQDFKSAAYPLLMSFSDEQRDEVRSLAHVMGLDQLASEF